MAITVYTTNIRPSSSVIGSLPLINPSAFGLGVYQWQTSSDLGLGSYIKTHGSESRGQEEAGLRDEPVSYLQVAPL